MAAKLLIGLAALVSAATTPAAPLYPDRTPGPFASAPETYGFLLGEVCLPYIVEGRPIADIAKARRLISMPASIVGASAQDKVWRAGSMTTAVYAVAWADGTCTVFTEGGSIPDLKAMGEAVVARRAEGFSPGVSEVLPDGQRARTTYCSAARPNPFVVTFTTAEPGSRRVRPISSTVFRSHAEDPPLCAKAQP